MATASAIFDSYQLWYYSSHTLDAYYDCLIYLYSGSSLVGRIEFYKEETPEASLKSQITSGTPRVKYRLSRFGDVMKILHHDKPLVVFVNDGNGIGLIGTHEHEPIGEDEP